MEGDGPEEEEDHVEVRRSAVSMDLPRQSSGGGGEKEREEEREERMGWLRRLKRRY
jgi:hypothetical protein